MYKIYKTIMLILFEKKKKNIEECIVIKSNFLYL